MKESFADIVDYRFTAIMEDKLDDIESGDTTTEQVLSDFWTGFSRELDAANEAGGEHLALPLEETDMICEKCGAKMIVRNGRFGKFAACPNYPKCRNTKPLDKENKKDKEENTDEEKVEGTKKANAKKEVVKTDLKCEICGAELVVRSSKFGSFYACSNFPNCRYTQAIVEEVKGECPKCSGKLIKRRSRKAIFYGCEHYPECDFSSWDMPTDQKCPKCGKTLFRKKGKPQLICKGEGCDYTCEIEKEKKTKDE